MRSALILFLFFTLADCSNEMVVKTDYDRSVSVQRLTSYNWLAQTSIESRNNPLYYNELNDKRIKDAVDSQLKLKGYKLSTSDPGMLVHYHIIVEDRSLLRNEELGHNYGRYWLENRAENMRFAEGTLIIDFMDATNDNLLWRGWAVSVVDDTELLTEALINEAVEKIFRRFPDAAVKEMMTPE